MIPAQPHFEWPVITKGTIDAVVRQLGESISIYDRSGVIDRLESQLEQYLGVEHAVLMNSGTSAIHAAYVALDLKPSDEVIVPNYTFFATATPIFQTGAVPVFVDCDERGGLDPVAVESALTSKTKAIVVTHMWGLPAQINKLSQLARRHDLVLVEDISHAFGATVDGKPVGSFGDIAVQSLQAQKPLNGGEGGVFYTRNSEYFYRAISIAHYNKRCKNEIPDSHPLAEYALTGFGLKWRIHPIAAAIVEQQLSEFSGVLAGRNRVAQYIAAAVSCLKGVDVILPREGETSSWYALLLNFDLELLGLGDVSDIEKAFAALGATEIEAPNSTRPLTEIPLFGRPEGVYHQYSGSHASYDQPHPNCTSIRDRVLKLPVWHRDQDMEIVKWYVDCILRVAKSLDN